MPRTLKDFESHVNALGFDVVITAEHVRFNNPYVGVETMVGGFASVPTKTEMSATLEIALVVIPDYQSTLTTEERYEHAMKILENING